MLGLEINKGILDSKVASAALELRSAFEEIETIAAWLANHPNPGDADPLVTEFGYNSDEAYILRVYFETFNTIRINNASIFAMGRKMTGLE